MADSSQEIRATFFAECEELHEAIQDGLAQVEGDGWDGETINIVFRAVHSIKGGAAAFGFDSLVEFAHSFESALDEVRSGRLRPTTEHLKLYFRSADLLSDLVVSVRDGIPVNDAAVATALAQLETAAGEPASAAHDTAIDFVPTPISIDLDLDDPTPAGDRAETRLIIISFRPHPELYENGHEPLHLIRALRDLGAVKVFARLDDTPPLVEYSGKESLLSWTIELVTAHDADVVRDVFEFVDGYCDLTIEVTGDAGGAVFAPDNAPLARSAPNPPSDAGTNTVGPESASASGSVKKGPAAGGPPIPRRPIGTSGSADGATTPKAIVRVDLDRIERLVNLVGELVINQSMLSQSITEAGLSGDGRIDAGLDEFLQLTRDLQDSVMMIRAQPVKTLFQRMGRIVRETSATTGKAVRLITVGETTEIDKTMIERLSDPLTHLIRNAVDHGLERGEERIKAGKPEEGTVTLTASHRSDRVIIEVSDDGGGIDRPKVQATAEGKGLISNGLELSDGEIDNLLFLPGFSTAGQLSNLSGRGVGMDVVKSVISSMGGQITISSAPARGTTFSISLPLTLAVMDGMIIGCADQTLVVPLSAIIETLRLRDTDLSTVGPSAIAVRVRDSFVPLVDLAAWLGYAEPRKRYGDAIALLVALDESARIALVVDTIVDQRQVVIKGLEHSAGRVPGVAAATILGDGRIALILDPSEMMNRANNSVAQPFSMAEAG